MHTTRRRSRRPANSVSHLLRVALPGAPRPTFWDFSIVRLQTAVDRLRMYYLNTYGLDPSITLVRKVAEETRQGGRSVRIMGSVSRLP